MSSPCAQTAAQGSEVDVRPRLLWFLALALMSALLNSSVPTPLYPHYQAALALSDLGLSLIYGGYAGGVLIALFGVGNLAGRVGGSAHPDTARPAGGRGGGPALLPGGQLLVAAAGAGPGRDRHWGPDRRRQCGAAALWPQGWRQAGGSERHPLLHRRAGAGASVQRLGTATGLLPDPGAIFADPGDGGLRHRGAGAELAQGRQDGGASAASGQGGGSLGEGLRATGAGFLLCALALFTAWAVAASLLAIGPKVVSQLLGMRDLGLFGYLIAAYLVFSGLCQLWARRLDARHTLQSGCLALALCVLLFAGAVHGLPGWLAGLGLLVAGYAQGAVFVGSATLINRIAPPASHARLVSLFYVIALSGELGARVAGLGERWGGLCLAALDLLAVGSTLISLGLAWALSRRRFEPAS